MNNRNIKAFLMVIRRCEGTSDAAGYRRLFGGALFNDYSKHPEILVKKSGYASTAAGAYQFIKATWRRVADKLGLTDFSPLSQDRGAIELIAEKGAYSNVVAGELQAALQKCSSHWASLPYSTAGQPKYSFAQCKTFFKQYGGIIS